MADALIFEFASGVSADDYNAVNDILGLDPGKGGEWPSGLLSHTGGSTPSGGFIVFEVWDSQAQQEQWMASQLGPALEKAGVTAPTRVEWLTVAGNVQP